jgi:O-antigen/teichoic acid export membrane protein
MSRLLLSIKKYLPKNPFVRGVGVLVGGTAASQILLLLAAPLLTRLYSPENFGLLAVYTGLLALFSVVASLRYELAIPLPKSDIVAGNLLALSLLIVFLMTAISGLMIVLAGEEIARLLNEPALVSYFWLLPAGVLFSGIYKVFNLWAIRVKSFGDIAKTSISQTLASLTVQLVGFKLGGIALLFGQLIGQGTGSFRLASSALKNRGITKCSWTGIWGVAKRYKQFPIFSTWSGLFNTAGTQLPPLMFAALFGSAAAGLYVLSHRVLAMPIVIIGDALGKVFFSNAAEAYRNGDLAPLVEKVHTKLAEIVMPVILILVIIGPDMFAFIFGEDWVQAGVFSRYMAPWLYIVFITSPLSLLFTIMERQRQGMLFQGGLLLARVGAILIGATQLNDLLASVMLFSAVSTIFWTVFLFWVCFISGNAFSVVLWPTFTAFIKASAALSPLILSMYVQSESLVWLYGGIIVTGITLTIYYINIFRKAYLS